MPVPTETLRKMKTVNLVFAATSLITLVTMFWMLWHDFDRKWRDTQIDYFNLRSAMAHFSVLSYDSPEEQEKRSQLVKALEDATAALETDSAKARIEKLEAEVGRLDGLLQGAALAFGDLNAEIQVTAFDVDEHGTLHGAESPKTKESEEKLAARELNARLELNSAMSREERASMGRLAKPVPLWSTRSINSATAAPVTSACCRMSIVARVNPLPLRLFERG